MKDWTLSWKTNRVKQKPRWESMNLNRKKKKKRQSYHLWSSTETQLSQQAWHWEHRNMQGLGEAQATQEHDEVPLLETQPSHSICLSLLLHKLWKNVYGICVWDWREVCSVKVERVSEKWKLKEESVEVMCGNWEMGCRCSFCC